jgi:hypothetical protein
MLRSAMDMTGRSKAEDGLGHVAPDPRAPIVPLGRERKGDAGAPIRTGTKRKRIPAEAIIRALELLTEEAVASGETVPLFGATEVAAKLHELGYLFAQRTTVYMRLVSLAGRGEIVAQAVANAGAALGSLGSVYGVKGTKIPVGFAESLRRAEEQQRLSAQRTPPPRRHHVAPGHTRVTLALPREVSAKLRAASRSLGVDRHQLAADLLREGLSKLDLDRVHRQFLSRCPPLPRSNPSGPKGEQER